MYNLVEQINEQIGKAKHVLIAIPKGGKGDNMCAAVSLAQYLRAQKKRVDIVCDSFSYPEQLNFLKNDITEIQDSLPAIQALDININIAQTPLSELSYDVKDDVLNIHIAIKKGTISPKQVKTNLSAYRYDTIITIGAPDLNALGATSQKAADMFYELPVINIDHTPGNEHYGQINVVELSASSNSELVFRMLDKLGEHTLTQKTAHILLTGIILETKSFKTNNVTPKLLTIASRLMTMGAQRDDIVENLFRTRTLSSLKLWGAALAELQHDPRLKLAWSVIPREIFIRAKTTHHELDNIIEEIIVNSPEAEIIILLHENTDEQKNETRAIIATTHTHDARSLTQSYKGNKTPTRAKITFKNKTLIEAEKELISHIKTTLEKTTA